MKVAEFEKVSRERFEQDLISILNREEDCYDAICLPMRATQGSAGYDFFCPLTVCLQPGETCRIPTGIRCRIDPGYVLQLYPRSSFGFKYQMCLLNTTGIIDSDYYGADNEGHIIIGIVNRGNRELLIEKGVRFVQGVFLKYYLSEGEENGNVRHGGFGSTG